MFFFSNCSRVKHSWRRASSALLMVSPLRHFPPSAAAPPSKEWYLKSKRSVITSWISALWPDPIQMLLVKSHSYRVTSLIGEVFLSLLTAENGKKIFQLKKKTVTVWKPTFAVLFNMTEYLSVFFVFLLSSSRPVLFLQWTETGMSIWHDVLLQLLF